MPKETVEIFTKPHYCERIVDYFLMEGFYFGVEIKPVNYLYTYNAKKPGPGLEILDAKSNTFSFFTQPFLKLGFKF